MTEDRQQFPSSEPSALARLQRNPQDETAWREFIGGASPPLLRYLYRFTRNLDLARDILQDVLLRFVEQKTFRKVSDSDAALALLRVMARNRFIDWFRSARATRAATLERSAAADAGVGATSSGEAAAILDDEIDHLQSLLSETERQLLTLMLNGDGLATIARTLDVSYSSAAVRLFRLREKLRHLSDVGTDVLKL